MANEDAIQKLQRRIADLDRQNQNLTEELLRKNNGHEGSDPVTYDLNPGSQRGLKWRKEGKYKILHWFAKGACYEWVVWKVQRDTGCIEPTARLMIEDALKKEPEFKGEPKGGPADGQK